MLTQLAVLALSEDAHGGVGGIVVGGYGGTIVCCPTGLVALVDWLPYWKGSFYLYPTGCGLQQLYRVIRRFRINKQPRYCLTMNKGNKLFILARELQSQP